MMKIDGKLLRNLQDGPTPIYIVQLMLLNTSWFSTNFEDDDRLGFCCVKWRWKVAAKLRSSIIIRVRLIKQLNAMFKFQVHEFQLQRLLA